MEKCCLCSEKKWLNPSQVVWIDSEGQGYCVFHAPEGKKRKQLGSDENHTRSSYHDIIYKEIDDSIESSKRNNRHITCELSGTVFPWDISFSKYNGNSPLPSINLHGALFVKSLDSENVHYAAEANFMFATFGRSAKFGYAVFLGDAIFEFAKFNGEAKFHGVHFNCEAYLSNAECYGDISFCGAVFNGKARFGSTNFLNEVCFISTHFARSVTFSYLIFPSKIDFRDSTVENLRIVLMGLSRECMQNIVFSAAEVQNFSFQGCKWPIVLGYEKFMDEEYGYLECEQLYRAMKQESVQEHDQLMASQWHYREKLTKYYQYISFQRFWTLNFLLDCFRQDGNIIGLLKEYCAYLINILRRSVPSLLFWYWATSGFGERAVRAGLWLVALLGVSFLANAWTPSWDWNTAIPLSAAANATMTSIPFAKDIPGDGWVKVARGVWQFLIAVQFTLFALAVRNRFRR